MTPGVDGETDLFGNPVAPLKPHEESRPKVNDMELIEKVLREASSVGFVLVGIREDVYRRVTDDVVEKMPADVDHAVHQLIDSRWLEIGGTHHVRYDRYTGPARSVLVPRKSKQAAYRWGSLAKLPRASARVMHIVPTRIADLADEGLAEYRTVCGKTLRPGDGAPRDAPTCPRCAALAGSGRKTA